MKKTFLILLSALMLFACQPTPDEEIVVQKDTDRLVETVMSQSGEANDSPNNARSDPAFIKSDMRYTFDYTSDNGCLTVHADADIYLPASGKISMARVKQVNFTDDFMKKAFDVHFHDQKAYVTNSGTYVRSKNEIANEILYYQDLVDTGRTDNKLMTEDEAIAYIEELKEEFQNAPDESIQGGPLVSDGTPIRRENDSGLGVICTNEMAVYNDSGSLSIYSSETSDGIPTNGYYTYFKGQSDTWISGGGDLEGYTIGNWYDPYRVYKISGFDTECKYGQSFSPADAVDQCKAYMEALGVTDILPFRDCDLYVAKSGDQVKAMYLINYVRTAAGSPTTYVPFIQLDDYDAYEIP